MPPAAVPILHRWQEDGRNFLLIRRSLSDPQEQRYYFVFAAPGTTLPEMVKALGARCLPYEDFANAKDLGLDHYEVRSFAGWYRHITLVLLALADLTGICATERFSLALPAPCELPARACRAGPDRSRSAPSAGEADLARFFVLSSGAGLVVVASLPSKSCQLLPAETSSQGGLILPRSHSTALGIVLSRTYFPDFQEISWKCRSSWNSVRVLSPICSFLRKEF
jgi:hypothetical protein